MNAILGMVKDSTGQLSSTRVGKLIMIACWAFNVVMHILDPSIEAPDMILTSAVLGAMGISTAHKAVEGARVNPQGVIKAT